MRTTLTTTLLAILTTISLQAATLVGKVVRVADGDTLTILDATNVQHKVRLHGIDAPERKQAYGEASRKALAERASVGVSVHPSHRQSSSKVLSRARKSVPRASASSGS